MSKKESKVKDVEAGEDKEEESKELLEKKEGKNFRDNLGVKEAGEDKGAQLFFMKFWI